MSTPVTLGTATQAGGVATTLSITTGQDTPAGTLVFAVAGVHSGATGISSFTDSAGNTYTQGNLAGTVTPKMCAFWCLLTSDLPSGGTATVTFSSTTGIQYLIVCSVAGVSSGTPDVNGTGAGTTTPSTTPSYGPTPTLAQPSEIAFGFVDILNGASKTVTEATGFNTLAEQANTGNDLLHLAYQVTTSTAALTYNPTLSSGGDWNANIVTFPLSSGSTASGAGAATGSATGAGTGAATDASTAAATGSASVSGTGASNSGHSGAGTATGSSTTNVISGGTAQAVGTVVAGGSAVGRPPNQGGSMARLRHVSVATAIEKNRVASDKAFILLISFVVTDALNNYVETVYLAQNSENYVWQGNTYIASNFKIDIKSSADSEPELRIDASDPSGFIRERMAAYGGGIGFATTVTVVNTGNPNQPAEIQEIFEIVGASQNGFNVSFTLGVDNPLRDRFPRRLMYRDQCTLLYKGTLCKYAGSLPSCDYTFQGPNGCTFHNNSINFGGFRGMQTIFTNG